MAKFRTQNEYTKMCKKITVYKSEYKNNTSTR